MHYTSKSIHAGVSAEIVTELVKQARIYHGAYRRQKQLSERVCAAELSKARYFAEAKYWQGLRNGMLNAAREVKDRME